MTTPEQPAAFGANSWLVEEMYEQFRTDPDSVSVTWREFFDDYKPMSPQASAPAAMPAPAAEAAPAAPPAPAPAAPVPAPAPATAAAETAAPETAAPEMTAPAAKAVEVGEPIRGAGMAIAANMERSLAVPTATSFRNVPAKLLEVNRSVINGYRSRTGQGKVSFTHLIGFAIVRAIADAVPGMNNSFVADAEGKPRIVRNQRVNMGLAVDVGKADGSRTLVVPVLRDADELDFSGFLAAYEDLIRKVKTNKLAVSDFQGATISLTNPGTIGTVQSVPRLMPGQGVIVGVGTIDYPAEFQGSDERTLGALGVSKVVTITSTYDHRIIQGAESGMFLKRVHELLLGEHDFYGSVFRSLGVPYEAVQWRVDTNPVNNE
jgi:2-oxoglutarate dehydrogenase E1 component